MLSKGQEQRFGGMRMQGKLRKHQIDECFWSAGLEEAHRGMGGQNDRLGPDRHNDLRVQLTSLDFGLQVMGSHCRILQVCESILEGGSQPVRFWLLTRSWLVSQSRQPAMPRMMSGQAEPRCSSVACAASTCRGRRPSGGPSDIAQWKMEQGLRCVP